MEFRNQIKIFIAIVVVIILIVYLPLPGSNQISQNTGEQQNTPDPFTQSVSSPQEDSCSTLNDPAVVKNCKILKLSGKAIEQDNANVCYEDPEITDECLSKYNLYKASQTNDASYCEGIEEKDQCYFDLARRNNDRSMCEKIEDQSIKTNCLNFVA